MHSSMIAVAMGIFLVFLSSSMALPIGETTPMYETSSPSSLKHEPRSLFIDSQPLGSFDGPLISSVNVLPGNSIIGGTGWSGTFIKRHEVGDNDLESSTPKASETGDKKEPRAIFVDSIEPASFDSVNVLPGNSIISGSYFLRRGLNDLESSTPRYHGLTETASDEKAPRALFLGNDGILGGSVVYDPVNVWSGSNSYFLRRGLGQMNDFESSTPKDEKVPRNIILGDNILGGSRIVGEPMLYENVLL